MLQSMLPEAFKMTWKISKMLNHILSYDQQSFYMSKVVPFRTVTF